ncbi:MULTISPECIES: FtsK/SpoIIIE domain-containing protein [Cytobacillus]|uniref:FtsK/SpoIIIE domain-containing protein n=1 Tax=Cytobacillus TaxID=2675230 RepID=UPI0012FD5C4E|nr:DNA segregation ATPase FtsK/SpoIIIE-like protein [Cytobacillus kochii]
MNAITNPDDVEFYILDLKGGMEFSKYEGLPNVKSIACDLFESTKTLAFILEDIKKRQNYMKKNGYTNIVDTFLSLQQQ